MSVGEDGGPRSGRTRRVETFLHRLVQRPRVYELVQSLAGARAIDRAMAPLVRRSTAGRESGVVLDVGGGTGRSQSQWPRGWMYVCIEPDDHKTVGTGAPFRRISGSAGQLPVVRGAVTAVLMRNVAHHLDDGLWTASLAEVRRVLDPAGTLLFLDPLWVRSRWLSRALWRHDVGRHPRSQETLLAAISADFEVVETVEFTTLHRFVLLLAMPRASCRT